ncbi:MAG: type II toxin-antitoxin system CcdA family antitoxin [Geminicoccaceae bacterium]
MITDEAKGALRRAANLSIDSALLREARALNVNISRAAEAGIARAVADARARAWIEENRGALASSNRHVERHGLPLARHRQF